MFILLGKNGKNHKYVLGIFHSNVQPVKKKGKKRKDGGGGEGKEKKEPSLL